VTERLYPSFGILLVDDEVAWLRSLALTLERVAGSGTSCRARTRAA